MNKKPDCRSSAGIYVREIEVCRLCWCAGIMLFRGADGCMIIGLCRFRNPKTKAGLVLLGEKRKIMRV